MTGKERRELEKQRQMAKLRGIDGGKAPGAVPQSAEQKEIDAQLAQIVQQRNQLMARNEELKAELKTNESAADELKGAIQAFRVSLNILAKAKGQPKTAIPPTPKAPEAEAPGDAEAQAPSPDAAAEAGD